MVGGKTGATLGRKFSVEAVLMRLDLPVPWSPATTIRTPVRACGLTVLGTTLTIDDAGRRKPRIEKRIRVRLRCNEAKTKGKEEP